MRVVDVLSDVALKLERNDLIPYWKGWGEEDLSEDTRELLSYYNETERDIALEFFPLVAKQKMQADDGEIFISLFNAHPVSIQRVENLKGEKIEYESFPNYIKVKENEVYVTYHYLPKEKDLEGDCSVMYAVPKEALVYGVLKNYYLSRGMLQEASAWNKNFYSLMKELKYGERKAKKICGRKWV